MPDLPTRTQYEDALTLLIRRALEEDRRRIEAGGRFSREAQAARVREEAAPVLASIFGEAAQQIGDRERWGLSTAGLNTEARVWANMRAAALGEMMAAKTLQMLADGWDLASIFGVDRAASIGITETTGAVTAGERWVFAWATDNVLGDDREVERTWHTEGDARVCEICRPLDGREEDYWRRLFPDGPPAHPRCRCWIDYRILRQGE